MNMRNLIPFLLAACAAQPTPPSGPTLEDAATLAAGAACDRLATCQPATLASRYGDVATCVDELTARLEQYCVATGSAQVCSPLDPSMPYGEDAYATLATCVDAYERVPCATTYTPMICTVVP